MEIRGLEGMSTEQVNLELRRGGRFVVFQYCISAIVMTFKRGSDVYFIRADDMAWDKRLMFSAISLVAGWWGIPWGPIYTVSTIFNNLTGGKNVTAEILAALNQSVTSNN